jgi:hypothetical protein
LLCESYLTVERNAPVVGIKSRIKFRLFFIFYIGSPKREAALHPTRKHPARALDTKRLLNFIRLQTVSRPWFFKP